MDTVRIGLSIRALRRRRGLSQERLARLVGVSRSTVARIERGREGPRGAPNGPGVLDLLELAFDRFLALGVARG